MGMDLKQTVRRMMEEVFGKGSFDQLDSYCGQGYRVHDYGSGGDFDRDGQKKLAQMYRTAFPDLKPTITQAWIDHDGDTVITNWSMTGTHQKPLMGIEPTGKRCTAAGCTITRFKGGKAVEEWVHWDALGLMRQLGVVPAMDALGAAQGRPESRPHA